jgi:hypothetical protein
MVRESYVWELKLIRIGWRTCSDSLIGSFTRSLTGFRLLLRKRRTTRPVETPPSLGRELGLDNGRTNSPHYPSFPWGMWRTMRETTLLEKAGPVDFIFRILCPGGAVGPWQWKW